jgi:hypothetical protein
MMCEGILSVDVFSPREISSVDRVAFERMVLAGGEVNPGTLPGLIDRAVALALLRVNGVLLGVSGIKRPYDSHRRDVFLSARASVDWQTYSVELGWTYVDPTGRGRRFGSILIQELIPSLKGESAFATSRANNERMHSSLTRFGFVPVGVAYPSKQNDQNIRLFVREKA